VLLARVSLIEAVIIVVVVLLVLTVVLSRRTRPGGDG